MLSLFFTVARYVDNLCHQSFGSLQPPWLNLGLREICIKCNRQQIYTCLKVIFSQIQSETLSISQFQLCPSPRAQGFYSRFGSMAFSILSLPVGRKFDNPGMTPGHLTPLPFWSSTWQKTEMWFLFWFRQCAVHTLRGRSRVWDKPGHLIKKFVSTREFVKLKPGDWPGMGMGTAGKHCCNSTFESARWFSNKWNTQHVKLPQYFLQYVRKEGTLNCQEIFVVSQREVFLSKCRCF